MNYLKESEKLLAIWDILRLNREFLSITEITELINLNKDRRNPEEITVSRTFVYHYLQALAKAGYLARKFKHNGDKGRKEVLYRLKKDTGAIPPTVLSLPVIYDPNDKCIYYEEIDNVIENIEKQGKRIVRKETIARGN